MRWVYYARRPQILFSNSTVDRRKSTHLSTTGIKLCLTLNRFFKIQNEQLNHIQKTGSYMYTDQQRHSLYDALELVKLGGNAIIHVNIHFN